eukprot:gene4307-3122_t
MPSGPKNKYTNRHAVEANERKQERMETEKQAREKAKEDAMWETSDKRDLKRAERDEEQAQKLADRARREAEKREQLEMEELAAAKKPPAKVSKRQLQKELSKMCKDYDMARDAIRGVVSDTPAPSSDLTGGNPNHDAESREKEGPEQRATASGSAGNADIADDSGINNRNIGKRARAMYRAYFEEQLEKMKESHPGLRRTQYHNLIWEEWLKCPANPFAQRKEKQAQERLEAERRWIQGEDDDNSEDAEA